MIKNKSLIFLILSIVMSSLSVFWGHILNNLYIGVNTKYYHYRSVDYPFLQNIPIEQIHLEFLNIFFAVLFAVFLTLSIFTSTKEKEK